MICMNCGGEMFISDVDWYIRGYIAAGKKADDVWPHYKKYVKEAQAEVPRENSAGSPRRILRGSRR